MDDITIPEAAVEAAARTAWEMNRDDPRWFPFGQLTETDRGLVKGDAYVVLAAAAPHIAAQALRDEADRWFDMSLRGPDGSDHLWVSERLRARADRIEDDRG